MRTILSFLPGTTAWLSILLTAALPSTMAAPEARLIEAVVRGQALEAGDPFRRLVVALNTDPGSCTGVLLDQYFVLTAAHCLFGKESVEVSFLEGSEKRRAIALPHPKYEKVQFARYIANRFDLALLKLSHPVPFPLPFTVDYQHTVRDFSGGNLLILGTGTNERVMRYFEAVAKVEGRRGRVVSNEFPGYEKLEIQAEAGACSGDSGGPTFFEKKRPLLPWLAFIPKPIAKAGRWMSLSLFTGTGSKREKKS
jgi:hypothetical protein